jgi:sugar O-acyltransferase (sialic acid O-acetyltransferase NeuD family)
MRNRSSDRVRSIVVSQDGDIFDLLDRMEEIEVVGFLDPSPTSTDPIYARLGDDNAWRGLLDKEPTLRAILAVDPPLARARLARYYGWDSLLTIVASTATVSRTARLGAGSIVQHGVNVGRNSRVGRACKLNSEAYLHHDVMLEDYCTVGPGARLLGNVSIGAQTYVGSDATVLPRKRIGAGVVIGAGAVVTRNIPDGATVKGVPAK